MLQQLKGYCHNYDWLGHLATFLPQQLAIHEKVAKRQSQS